MYGNSPITSAPPSGPSDSRTWSMTFVAAATSSRVGPPSVSTATRSTRRLPAGVISTASMSSPSSASGSGENLLDPLGCRALRALARTHDESSRVLLWLCPATIARGRVEIGFPGARTTDSDLASRPDGWRPRRIGAGADRVRRRRRPPRRGRRPGRVGSGHPDRSRRRRRQRPGGDGARGRHGGSGGRDSRRYDGPGPRHGGDAAVPAPRGARDRARRGGPGRRPRRTEGDAQRRCGSSRGPRPTSRSGW